MHETGYGGGSVYTGSEGGGVGGGGDGGSGSGGGGDTSSAQSSQSSRGSQVTREQQQQQQQLGTSLSSEGGGRGISMVLACSGDPGDVIDSVAGAVQVVEMQLTHSLKPPGFNP
jgi:hypothetical protein